MDIILSNLGSFGSHIKKVVKKAEKRTAILIPFINKPTSTKKNDTS